MANGGSGSPSKGNVHGVGHRGAQKHSAYFPLGQFFPAAFIAASMVASGSSRINGASNNGMAP